MTRALVLALIVGCGAPDTPAHVPQQAPDDTPTATTDPSPPLPHSDVAGLPSIEPATPEGKIRPAPFMVVYRRHPAIVGTPGFWCAERTALPDSQASVVSECYREKDTCTQLRAERVKTGEYAPRCHPADQAVCFFVEDPERQEVSFRCYETQVDCEIELPIIQRQRLEAKHSNCFWTSALDQGRTARGLA